MGNRENNMHQTITRWIAEYLYFNIDNENLTSVKDFMILWNIFEFKAPKKQGKESFAKTMARAFNTLTLDTQLIDYTYSFIHSRYVNNGKINSRFRFLYKDNIGKKEVEKILLKTNDISKDQKLKVIAGVIYKYRCNLFHGDKDLAGLTVQNEIFDESNQFLLVAIDAMYRHR